MYCKKCGKELQTGSKFCSGCGNATTRQEETQDTSNRVSIEAFVSFIVGLIGTIYALAIIINDMTSNWHKYTYVPPWTEHEAWMLMVLLGSVIFFGMGLYGLLNKRK